MMTFDNAEKKLQKLGNRGTKVWYGPQLDEHTKVKGLLELGEVQTIISSLRREYEEAEDDE